jgi:hypothetical protein
LKEKKLLDLYLNDNIDKDNYTINYNKIKELREKELILLDDLNKELVSKEKFRKKNLSTNFQIRTIKESKRILKKTINEVVDKMFIYPVFKHNIGNYRKVNKQDKFVFIEIFTYLNQSIPLIFVVSQRSDIIITPKYEEFRKEDCYLKIGGFDENEIEEEEASDINFRKLYHLSILD